MVTELLINSVSENKTHQSLSWAIRKIIHVANELVIKGKTGASTSEMIAAAFVLDNMAFLPNGYTVIDAWERLDDWQDYVKLIQRHYSHMIS